MEPIPPVVEITGNVGALPSLSEELLVPVNFAENVA
jgi:hypothetical protein